MKNTLPRSLSFALLLAGSSASAQLVQMDLNNNYTNGGSLGGSGFDDGSGSSFTASGGGYTGQAGDYAWVRSGSTAGLAFGAYENTSANFPALNNLTGATFTMWVKIPTPADGNFFRGEYATNSVWLWDPNEPTASEVSPGGWQGPGLDQSTLSSWTFISLRWDGVAGTTKVNQGGLAGGALDTPISVAGTAIGNTGAVVWNLRWVGDLGPTFPAGVMVDNARYYGSALSDTALQNLYNADVAAIPEPSTFGFLAGGLAMFAAIRRRRRG